MAKAIHHKLLCFFLYNRIKQILFVDVGIEGQLIVPPLLLLLVLCENRYVTHV